MSDFFCGRNEYRIRGHKLFTIQFCSFSSTFERNRKQFIQADGHSPTYEHHKKNHIIIDFFTLREKEAVEIHWTFSIHHKIIQTNETL